LPFDRDDGHDGAGAEAEIFGLEQPIQGRQGGPRFRTFSAQAFDDVGKDGDLFMGQ
jgi:hypothetical protein